MNDMAQLLNIITVLSDMLRRQQDKTPEEGGWVRTENTAFRPNAANLSASKPPDPPKELGKPRKRGSGLNHRGYVECSLCGRFGRNSRTCTATFAAVKVGDMVRTPKTSPKLQKDGGVWRYTDQKHRKPAGE